MRKGFIIIISFFISSLAIGQIAKWTFETSVPATAGPHAPEIGSGQALCFHMGATTYSNFVGNGSGESFSSNNWMSGDYYRFLISTVNFTGIKIDFDQASSGTGPADFQIQYSIDGTNYTTITSYTVFESGTVPNIWSSGTYLSLYHKSFDFSSIPILENQATLYIRLICSSTTSTNGGTIGSTGTDRIDNFAIHGVYSGATPFTNYYSKSTGSLANVTTWGTNLDGSGTNPTNFTSDNKVFNVRNRVSTTLDNEWLVTGVGSKVIIGDSVNPTELIIPTSDTLEAIVNVSNNSRLTEQNSVMPTLGILETGSTVNYAQSATSYYVPTGRTFHHLQITSNTKEINYGAIIVNGNLVVNGVTDFNGSANTARSRIYLTGDFTLQNSATFKASPAGDNNGRIIVICTNTGTKNFTGGNFLLSSVESSGFSVFNVSLGSGLLLQLGDSTSGGLNLVSSNHALSLNGGELILKNAGCFNSSNFGTITGSNTSKLTLAKTLGTTSIGSIGFTSGSQILGTLTDSCNSPGIDTLNLLSSLTVNTQLRLVNGWIDVKTFDLTLNGTISGGSTSSYVQTTSTGYLVINNVTASRLFPVGRITYNPVTVAHTEGLNWKASVEDILNVDDPLYIPNIDKAVQRTWNVIPSVNPTTTGAYVEFSWNDDPSANPRQTGTNYINTEPVQIWQRFDHSPPGPWLYDWVAVNVTQPAGGTVNGYRTAFESSLKIFTPFAVSTLSGPLLVKLVAFDVTKISSTQSYLTWELAACCSKDAVFEIQKSTDSRNFVLLARVGGSETNRFYNYNDTHLEKGITYYRLKMMDVDGKISYSKVVAVINDSKGVLITSIAPNPVADDAVLNISSAKQGNIHLAIYNMAGVAVKQWTATVQEGNNTIHFNTGRLMGGIYHLVAISDDSRSVLRFVRQ